MRHANPELTLWAKSGRSFGARDKFNRAAFSLIELLVIIAVIVLLVAMVIPSIQRVRATADALRCKNNLRTIGQGASLYHQAKGKLPPGGVEWRPPGNTTRKQLAWSAYLLPYIEQETTRNQLDFNLPFDHPSNAVGAATVITTYLCPSRRSDAKLIDGRGACSYGGMFGERITSPNNPPKGVMIYDQAFRFAEINDGAGNTIMIAEDSRWPDGQWINGRNVFDQAFAINKAPAFENDMRSDHPGGAHALFADGTVRFLRETLDLRVLASLCTRSGSESYTLADIN